MNCPKCKIELECLKIKGLALQYCKTCKAMLIKFPTLKKIGEMLDLKSDILNPIEMEAVKVKEEARTCPDCGKKINIFGESHIDEIAKKHNIKVLDKLPIDPNIASACDNGIIESISENPIPNSIEAIENL